MSRIPLKIDKFKITKRLQDALDKGELKGMETNSNWIEFWYWYNFNEVEVWVDGVRYTRDQIGKLSKAIDSGETVRTIWSKMRRDLKLKQDLKAQQEFKEEFSKEN